MNLILLPSVLLAKIEITEPINSNSINWETLLCFVNLFERREFAPLDSVASFAQRIKH
jgi:hypothetical protein